MLIRRRAATLTGPVLLIESFLALQKLSLGMDEVDFARRLVEYYKVGITCVCPASAS